MRYLSEDEVYRLISELPQAYLQCRDMSHKWDLQHDYAIVDTKVMTHRQPRGGFTRYAERVLKCGRCGMVRSDAYALQKWRSYTVLDKINSGYLPPTNYRLKGVGRFGGLPSIVRGVAFERALQGGI